MKKKTWANVVLAASAVLTAAAAPYKDISLLAEGCFHLGFAATVGGFADWFGVASLFGKPLGIGKRTDIIAKDRDKIIRLARDMIHAGTFDATADQGACREKCSHRCPLPLDPLP